MSPKDGGTYDIDKVLQDFGEDASDKKSARKAKNSGSSVAAIASNRNSKKKAKKASSATSKSGSVAAGSVVAAQVQSGNEEDDDTDDDSEAVATESDAKVASGGLHTPTSTESFPVIGGPCEDEADSQIDFDCGSNSVPGKAEIPVAAALGLSVTMKQMAISRSFENLSSSTSVSSDYVLPTT